MCVFLSTFQIIYSTFFLLVCFLREIWCNSYPHSCIGKVFFSPFGFFQDFLFVFRLNMICLSIDFLWFILLGTLWLSWICGLVSVINFRNISFSCYYFKYFCCFFLLPSCPLSFSLSLPPSFFLSFLPSFFPSPFGIPITHNLYLL